MFRLFLMLFFISSTHASFAQGQFVVRDLGVIGLMSHDIFAWSRAYEINQENGRLDLSTIFDHAEGTLWETGGNPKNSENAPVYSFTMEIVELYKQQLLDGRTPNEARKIAVAYFHTQIKESYQRIRGRPFPSKGNILIPDNTQQAVLRAMHDILPGKIKLLRTQQNELIMTDYKTAKTLLTPEEQALPIPNFDGEYATEYREIAIPLSPMALDLKNIDGQFIEKFSSFKQSDMLFALKQFGQGLITFDEVFFIHHFDDMIARAICSTCNSWMPEVSCE